MVVKNSVDIAGLRRANRETMRLLRELAALVQPGVTTGELDDHAAAYLTRLGAEPIFHTEAGFPGCINTSVNDVVLHGVPGSQTLRAGDIISIDAGMRLDGYCGDANATVPVGAVGARRRRLIAAAHGAMAAGTSATRCSVTVSGADLTSFAASPGMVSATTCTRNRMCRSSADLALDPFCKRGW